MTAPDGAMSKRCSTRGCPEERLPLLVGCGRHVTMDVICILIQDLIRARASETRLEKEPKEALRCPSCETCDCGEFRDAFDALTREKREAEEARDEAERLLRLACERLTGTPLAEQSSFIHDISLAIDAAVQDFDATKEGDRG